MSNKTNVYDCSGNIVACVTPMERRRLSKEFATENMDDGKGKALMCLSASYTKIFKFIAELRGMQCK